MDVGEFEVEAEAELAGKWLSGEVDSEVDIVDCCIDVDGVYG